MNRPLALPLACLLLAACRDPAPPAPAALAIADVLGGGPAEAAGFTRATAVPQLSFPRDHGAHPGFRTEWWYVTGNVADAAGGHFGVELVFFRQALAPTSTPRASDLAAHELILAHAAVTDVTAGAFHAEERLARLAGGLAELAGPGPDQPFRIVCSDWSARAAAGGDGFLPLDLTATGRDFAFSLRVSPGKPLVLQGENGLSRKSAEPGNASIYYSMTRVPLAGTLTVGGVPRPVQGLGWVDREWSTSALSPDQVGWDWFSLQLDDGSDVMWYRLRRRDGAPDPWSRGCVVAADGTARQLGAGAVAAAPDGLWRAADGAAAYPARWRLLAADGAFDLQIEPLVADQELRTTVRYWEGAVAVRGTHAGRAVTGRGYLEMTGYTGDGAAGR